MALIKITCDDCGEEYETHVRIGVPRNQYGPCLVCRKRQYQLSKLRYIVIGIVATGIFAIVISTINACG